MKKYIAITAFSLTLAIIANITGCSGNGNPGGVYDSGSEISESESAPEISSFPGEASAAPEISDSESDSGESGDTSVSAAELAKEIYNIKLPVVSAGEALQMTKIDMPEKIDGHNFTLGPLLDDKTLVIHLFDKLGANITDDFGRWIYDLETQEHTALPGLPGSCYRVWNRDYIVYAEYEGNVEPNLDDSVKLYLYDVNARQSTLIYTYSFNNEFEVGGHWKENIVLSDNKVYFDDYKDTGDTDEDGDPVRMPSLYAYDIQTGTLEKLKDYAENPMVYKDDILYVDSENKDRFMISSLGGKYETEMDKVNYFLPLKERLLAIDMLSYDEETNEGVWVIKDMFTGEVLVETANYLSNPYFGSDIFTAFSDFGYDPGPPVVYNSADNNFAVFDDLLGENVYWWFCSDAGLAYTTVSGICQNAYIVKLK